MLATQPQHLLSTVFRTEDRTHWFLRLPRRFLCPAGADSKQHDLFHGLRCASPVATIGGPAGADGHLFQAAFTTANRKCGLHSQPAVQRHGLIVGGCLCLTVTVQMKLPSNDLNTHARTASRMWYRHSNRSLPTPLFRQIEKREAQGCLSRHPAIPGPIVSSNRKGGCTGLLDPAIRRTGPFVSSNRKGDAHGCSSRASGDPRTPCFAKRNGGCIGVLILPYPPICGPIVSSKKFVQELSCPRHPTPDTRHPTPVFYFESPAWQLETT